MWDNEKCLLLVDLYETKRVLWDTKYVNYFNRQEKEDAWKYISGSLHIDVEEIKKKMSSLLGSFRRERSKQKRSSTKGKGFDEIYKSKWFAFERMQFLADKNDPTSTVDTLNNEGNDCDNEDNKSRIAPPTEERDLPPTDSHNPPSMEMQNLPFIEPRSLAPLRPPLTSSFPRKRSRFQMHNTTTDPAILEALKVLKDSSKDVNDPYVSYAFHIAHELRKYDKITLACVKHAISNILFEADMGHFGQKYTKYNDTVNNYRQYGFNTYTTANQTPSSNDTINS